MLFIWAPPKAANVANYILSQDKKANGKCRMTVSAASLPNIYVAVVWGFPIGSPLPQTVIDQRLNIVIYSTIV